MNLEEFRALRESITRGSFSRRQLGELLGDVVGRICTCDEPELREVRVALSDAHEAYGEAIEAVDERELLLIAAVDECDLAKQRRAVQEPV